MGSLEGTHYLAVYGFLDTRPQRPFLDQVHRTADQVCKPVLDANNVK